jgi:beta-lactamase class D
VTRKGPRWILAFAACAALGLGGCDRIVRLVRGPGFDTNTLEAALDPAIGGPDTCVVIVDTASGAELYRYGDHAVCNRPLAPCATFHAPMALIGLDDGLITPRTVWRWDLSPQPSSLWRQDANLASAFQWAPPWWWRRLATAIGPPRFAQRLQAFGYGQGRPIGDPQAFWQGPVAGGGLFISTNNQAAFLGRLYRGQLPVSPGAAAAVQGLMIEERRGDTVLSGLVGSCPSIADNSRNLGWWAGRIKSPKRDLIFAISIEGQNALPGLEIRRRTTPILVQAGLLPPRP